MFCGKKNACGKLLKFFAGLSGVLALGFGLEYFKSNIMATIGILLLLVIMSSVFIKRKQYNNNQLSGFLIISLLFGLYLVIRTSTGIYSQPIMQEFLLNTSGFAKFSVCFAMGYGIFQIFSGYCISKFGFRGLVALSVFAGFGCIGLSFLKIFNLILFTRFLIGLFCSGIVSGMGYFINLHFRKNVFNFVYILCNAIGLVFSYIVNNFLGNYAINHGITWRHVLQIAGVSFFILSVLFFLVISCKNFVLGIKKNEAANLPHINDDIKENCGDLKNKHTEENLSCGNKNNNCEKNEEISVLSLIKDLFTDFRLILLCVYSATATWLLFPMQDGYSTFLIKACFPLESIHAGTTAVNMAYGIGVLLCSLLAEFIAAELAMVICSLLQVIGIILLLTVGVNSFGVLIMCINLFALCGASHLLPTIIIGRNYSGKKIAFFFGAANFSAMFLGASLAQFFSGYLIHRSWLSHKTTLLAQNLYLAPDVLYMVKVFAVPSIICFFCALFLYFKSRKNGCCFK